MPRLLPLLLCLLASLACAEPAQLRIQGSNTIGAALGPALVRGLLQAQGASAIERQPGVSANETTLHAVDRNGLPLHIDIAAHGTSTGFAALARGEADLAAASRPISDSELQQSSPWMAWR
ncbi:hypothetical protein WR25_21217 [Diploscapter pachys]|uniref:PBP domain-containing protein n=1 Tax=Diploscapter pachys TaxID=2018661 RepID=A0A2A2M4D8_9BILA|nr:hypothetical protein WR25_21217 [Diploscapter pachys]